MIKGLTQETMTKTFEVTGEAPVDRPYSRTSIVVDRVTVTYGRTTEHGWTPRKIDVLGWRAKVDGRAGGQALAEDWYFDSGHGQWSPPDRPPALWLTVLAANNRPKGGPLSSLSDFDPVDLDAVEG